MSNTDKSVFSLRDKEIDPLVSLLTQILLKLSDNYNKKVIN